MNINPWFMRAFLACIFCWGGTGCGTIRGKAPVFYSTPGAITMVDAPESPPRPVIEHLQKKLEFPPMPTDLMQADARSDNPNVIYFPGLRLQSENEVVRTEAVASGEITIMDDDLNELMDSLRSDPNGFLAITDLKNESAQEAASGRLAADFLYRKVKRNAKELNLNINIVDREKAFITMKGEGELSPNVLNYSEQELMNEAKKFNYTTFWLSGAVTTFSLENKELVFGYVLNKESYKEFVHQLDLWMADYRAYKEDYQRNYVPLYKEYVDKHKECASVMHSNYVDYEGRYEEYLRDDYKVYVREYAKYSRQLSDVATLSNLLFLPLHLALEIITLGDADTWTHAQPYPMQALIPKQMEPSLGAPLPREPVLDLSHSMPTRYEPESVMAVLKQNRRVPDPERRMATVCNVGITLRMVSGKTSKIVWIGNGTVRSTDLQLGMQDVCSSLVDVLFYNTGLNASNETRRGSKMAKP